MDWTTTTLSPALLAAYAHFSVLPYHVRDCSGTQHTQSA